MRLTRRELLAASAFGALAPRLSFAAPLPRETDIVVVGAGAAGIAAARRVVVANRRVVVIEATGQVGGRCQTDTATFDTPFDRGARWMYNQDTHPVVKLARGVGLDVAPVPQGQKIRIGRRYARAGEAEDFLATLVRTNRSINEAGRGRVDVACAAALTRDVGEWGPSVEFLVGAYGVGKDLKDVSAFDQSRALERTGAAFCRQGLGALIGKLGEAVPIVLSTPVTRIVWSGRDVEVETSAGRITARAVIVTASTNVLASGRIKFMPELPKRQAEALSKLTLGNQDRIAIELAGNPLGLGRDDVVIEQSANARTAFLVGNIGGASLCTLDIGGAFGRDLAAQGEKAMLAFGTEWLTKLFGSELSGKIRRTAVTRWDAMPFVQGAMSVAPPGTQPLRRVLMDGAGSLFLAGEAAHETQWGTVAGAWESGERAGEAALRKIGALKDSEPAQARPKRSRKGS